MNLQDLIDDAKDKQALYELSRRSKGNQMTDELRHGGLWYLATPYSKYPAGIEVAFQHAAKATADLLRAGVSVYSPIAHTHPVAVYGEVDPFDHDIWLPFDEAMMERANGIIVLKMETWDESRGIAHEIEVFKRAGKPVVYLDFPVIQ